MKHTEGKWRVNGYPRLTIQSKGGEICLINPSLNEDNENAKLIAKAPKMLEALKDIVKRYPNSPWIINEIQSLINEIES